jgi:hypothetical protein
MRYRLLASYQGAPYEAGVGPVDTGVVLFAACPPPEDLGFEPATGHWRKEVGRNDVHTLYESRPMGIFRGERCVVLDDLTDRLHIAYLGHDAFRAEQLGYWEVDRGVFELITPRQEVTEIIEQRIPVAATDHSDPFQQDVRGPGPAPEHIPAHANGPRPQPPSAYVLGGPGLHAAAHSSLPADDEHPLPLEAQAMRAARKAKKVQSEPAGGLSEPAAELSEPPAGRSEPPAGRSEPPAGLSEPSPVLPVADSPGPVPSWSPQPVTSPTAAGQPAPQTTAQPPPQQTSGQPAAEIPGHGGPSEGRPDGPVVSAGFVAGVSPAVAPSSAGSQNHTASAGSPAGPFIGSAPVPHPGPQLPGTQSAGGHVNGTHHGGQANAPVLRPGPGLPRDQLERPVSAVAASAPPDGTTYRAGSTPSAAGAPTPSRGQLASVQAPGHGSAAATAGVGVAVADPVQGMPYPPVAPQARLAGPVADPASQPVEAGESEPMSRRRRASRRRLPTQRIFSDLAAQAGIPPGAYAINADVDGAMCLVRTGEGFEVFNSIAGARHEVRAFQDEESAYFYLFGVLAAEAVRTGALRPKP